MTTAHAIENAQLLPAHSVARSEKRSRAKPIPESCFLADMAVPLLSTLKCNGDATARSLRLRKLRVNDDARVSARALSLAILQADRIFEVVPVRRIVWVSWKRILLRVRIDRPRQTDPTVRDGAIKTRKRLRGCTRWILDLD